MGTLWVLYASHVLVIATRAMAANAAKYEHISVPRRPALLTLSAGFVVMLLAWSAGSGTNDTKPPGPHSFPFRSLSDGSGTPPQNLASVLSAIGPSSSQVKRPSTHVIEGVSSKAPDSPGLTQYEISLHSEPEKYCAAQSEWEISKTGYDVKCGLFVTQETLDISLQEIPSIRRLEASHNE